MKNLSTTTAHAIFLAVAIVAYALDPRTAAIRMATGATIAKSGPSLLTESIHYDIPSSSCAMVGQEGLGSRTTTSGNPDVNATGTSSALPTF